MKEKIDRESYKPVLVNDINDRPKLNQIVRGENFFLADQIEDFILELFLLRNPKYKFIKEYTKEFDKFKNKYSKGGDLDAVGKWFYFPWLNTFIHFLDEKDHNEMRTGRNRNLITKQEQEKFYNSSVAVLGMSVGSHAALTIAMTGGAKFMKLVDFDVIGGSNLNRIRTGYQNVGLKKVVAVARQIYEMNPYSQVEIYEEGITENNMERIFGSKRKMDLIVEEMDSPYFKMKIREMAKRKKIPVIMAADHHDNAVVDIERYDSKSNLPLLHGLFGDKPTEEFKTIEPKEIVGVISKMAGAKHSSLRMLESVGEVGKTLYSWPQLGTAASLCGSVLAQLARRILVGEKVNSGRVNVDTTSYFVKADNKDEVRKAKILKLLGVE